MIREIRENSFREIRVNQFVEIRVYTILPVCSYIYKFCIKFVT